MKRLIGWVAVAMMLAGSGAVFAGGACCPARAVKQQAQNGCGDTLAGLDLSAEQQAKLAALAAECQQGKCSKRANQKFVRGVKEILTPQQYAQWQAQCEKARKSGDGCPHMAAQ